MMCLWQASVSTVVVQGAGPIGSCSGCGLQSPGKDKQTNAEFISALAKGLTNHSVLKSGGNCQLFTALTPKCPCQHHHQG